MTQSIHTPLVALNQKQNKKQWKNKTIHEKRNERENLMQLALKTKHEEKRMRPIRALPQAINKTKNTEKPWCKSSAAPSGWPYKKFIKHDAVYPQPPIRPNKNRKRENMMQSIRTLQLSPTHNKNKNNGTERKLE